MENTVEPVHSRVEGNEKADKLARFGSSKPFIGSEPVFGTSLSGAKQQIKSWMIQKTNERWNKEPQLRHSKAMLPIFNPKLSKYFLRLSRSSFKKLTGFYTGHGNFKKHLKTIGISEDDQCRLCNVDKETAEHLLGECDSLVVTRYSIFGRPYMDLNEIGEQNVNNILTTTIACWKHRFSFDHRS